MCWIADAAKRETNPQGDENRPAAASLAHQACGNARGASLGTWRRGSLAPGESASGIGKKKE